MRAGRVRAALLAACISMVAPVSAVEWEVAPGLDARQAAASRQILDDVRARLPPAWAAAVDRRLRIEWRDDLPPHVEGRYRGDVLRLRRGLLDGWQAADGDAAAPRRAARAAVLHELAHAWDRSPRGGLSGDPRLLDLAGWPVAPLRAGARVATNDFRDRSPDPYELARPGEFVAVNLEHFLLDPDYACRRPALHRWFARRAGGAPSTQDCAPPAFARPSSAGGADPSALLALDPARVYAIDYLLAEPDRQPMSRWGHSMLRLVVCAPGRAPGPACRLDIAWHEVLSFRAFVDDVQISSWRGLTGAYPSRLFVLPMPQVVEEYTKVELRGLRSVPLLLSREEIAALLERAAQVHWSYDGRYRFVTRNCAVETFRLLHDGVPRLAAADLSSLTPTGLLRRLERAGIADASPLRPVETARREGYRFDSMDAHFQSVFDTVRGALPVRQHRARDWLGLAPADRAAWFDRADLRATAALLVLENAALRRAELRAADALKRRLAGDRSPVSDRLQADTRQALALAARLTRPAALLPASGYGLPQAREREAFAAVLERDARQWRDRSDALRAAAEAALPEAERRRLAGARGNVERLGERVRRLAAMAAAPG